MSSRKRAKLGDILELQTPRGLAYVQYAGKHPEYGAAIRVLPGFFKTRPKDWGSLVAQEGYFTFYPVGVAVSQEVVEIAANQPLSPAHELPTRFRREAGRTREGKVLTWFICDGEKEVLKRELSEEERRLFIASVWNHAFLVEYLVREWHPEQEPSDESVAESPPVREEPQTPPGDEAPGRLSHYLYFPAQKASRAVAAELTQRGFEVVHRRGADGKNWLVLASHTLEDPARLESVREELEQLAQQHSGEYDGWELATGD